MMKLAVGQTLIPVFLSVLSLLFKVEGAAATSVNPHSQQTPAYATFNQGAMLLKDLYINRSPIDIDLQITSSRSRLDYVCRDRPSDCPVDEGIEALRGLYSSIGDTHLFVMGREALERGLAQALASDPMSDTFGLFFGASDDSAAVVTDVLPGSAADQGGIQAGDILQFDGRSPTLESLDLLPAVTLQVRRGGERRDVTLQRSRVPNQRQPLLYTPLNGQDGVAVLRIPTFVTSAAHSTGIAVHQLVKRAQEKGVRGLVIDLRYGTGGSGAECAAATGAFLGPFAFQAHTRRGVFEAGWDGTQSRLWERAFADVSPPVLADPAPLTAQQVGRWMGRTVVLVNRRTASCHELMAFMLQRAGIHVVGESTAGYLDTGSLLMPLTGGGAVGVAVVKNVAADGEAFPMRVTPDSPVTEDSFQLIATAEDRALQRALDILSK